MERTDVLHMEGLSLKSESNQEHKEVHNNKVQTEANLPNIWFYDTEFSCF